MTNRLEYSQNKKSHKIWNLLYLITLLVRERGLEPPQDCSHSHLKAACLPFHHPRRYFAPLNNTLFHLYKARIIRYYVLHCGRLAQLARAPRLHRGGRGFEPLSAHQSNNRPSAGFLIGQQLGPKVLDLRSG